MYIAELQELASMESQLGNALRRMSQAASHPSLKAALDNHQRETVKQSHRLEEILKNYGVSSRQHTDQAMEALVKETEKMMKMLSEDNLRDAGLIASMQKIKHYEIAAYGTAAALAGQLDIREDQRQLHESLEEERQADKALSDLAKSEINQDAVAA